jgi:hypothetical protein
MGPTIQGKGDWAIVGGTGVFEMARGVIGRTLVSQDSQQAIHKITIDGFCRKKVSTKTVCIYIYGFVLLFRTQYRLGGIPL